MKQILMMVTVILVILLAACGGDETAPAVIEDVVSGDSEDVVVLADSGGEPVSVGDSQEAAVVTLAAESVRLDENYNNALPVQSQLAIGILQLENGEGAVDESLAAELLPLWRAAQSLADSETAAEVEVTAVLNQIQETMSAEQLAAIAAMQLTDESFQMMLADGTITMRGVFGGNRGEGAGGPGGGPGGGLPGGGSGGGLPGSDPSAQQTRIAERMAASGDDEATFQMMAATGAVVRLLEGKMGEAPDSGFVRGGLFGEALTAVSETTGLSVEDVQAALETGKTLADIIQENGGDLETVQASLIDTAIELNFLQGQDPAQFVMNLLEGTGFSEPPGNE